MTTLSEFLTVLACAGFRVIGRKMIEDGQEQITLRLNGEAIFWSGITDVLRKLARKRFVKQGFADDEQPSCWCDDFAVRLATDDTLVITQF